MTLIDHVLTVTGDSGDNVIVVERLVLDTDEVVVTIDGTEARFDSEDLLFYESSESGVGRRPHD